MKKAKKNGKNREFTQQERSQLNKPCLKLDYCPYGRLAEDFPVAEPWSGKLACGVFGHVCPVVYVAESFIDNE